MPFLKKREHFIRDLNPLNLLMRSVVFLPLAAVSFFDLNFFVGVYDLLDQGVSDNVTTRQVDESNTFNAG